MRQVTCLYKRNEKHFPSWRRILWKFAVLTLKTAERKTQLRHSPRPSSTPVLLFDLCCFFTRKDRGISRWPALNDPNYDTFSGNYGRPADNESDLPSPFPWLAHDVMPWSPRLRVDLSLCLSGAIIAIATADEFGCARINILMVLFSNNRWPVRVHWTRQSKQTWTRGRAQHRSEKDRLILCVTISGKTLKRMYNITC